MKKKNISTEQLKREENGRIRVDRSSACVSHFLLILIDYLLIFNLLTESDGKSYRKILMIFFLI